MASCMRRSRDLQHVNASFEAPAAVEHIADALRKRTEAPLTEEYGRCSNATPYGMLISIVLWISVLPRGSRRKLFASLRLASGDS